MLHLYNEIFFYVTLLRLIHINFPKTILRHILDLQNEKKFNGVSTTKVPVTLLKLPFTLKLKMVRRNITSDFFFNVVPLLVVLA